MAVTQESREKEEVTVHWVMKPSVGNEGDPSSSRNKARSTSKISQAVNDNYQ